MKKQLLCLLLLCALVFSAAVPAAAAPLKPDGYAVLPDSWVQENQTEQGIAEKLDALEALSVTDLLCQIGGYAVTNSSGKCAVRSTVSLKSLPKWIKLAHQRGMKIYVSTSIMFSEKLYEESGKTTYGDQIVNHIALMAEKVLQDGLRYNGQLYYANGLHFDCISFRKDDQSLLQQVFSNVSPYLSGSQVLACTLPGVPPSWNAERAEAMLEACDLLFLETTPDLLEEGAESNELADSAAFYEGVLEEGHVMLLAALTDILPQSADFAALTQAQKAGVVQLGVELPEAGPVQPDETPDEPTEAAKPETMPCPTDAAGISQQLPAETTPGEGETTE